MRIDHALYPRHFLVHCLVLLSVAVCLLQNADAQQLNTSNKEFDTSKGVLFEEATRDTIRSTVSPDGSMRAETEFKNISIYAVEDNQLLHTFETSGNTTAPEFTADGTKLVAAVCRGNLGCIATLYQWDLKTGTRTSLGECNGLVLDISTNAANERYAAVTSYGSIASMMLFDQAGKWYCGEIVVLDSAKPDDKVRIFCELSSVSSPKDLFADKTKDTHELGEEVQNVFMELSQKYLPTRVGLTPDGNKVVAVTSSGVVRVFDAQTGKPELLLSIPSSVGE